MSQLYGPDAHFRWEFLRIFDRVTSAGGAAASATTTFNFERSFLALKPLKGRVGAAQLDAVIAASPPGGLGVALSDDELAMLVHRIDPSGRCKGRLTKDVIVQFASCASYLDVVLQARNIFPKTVAGAPLRSTGN